MTQIAEPATDERAKQSKEFKPTYHPTGVRDLDVFGFGEQRWSPIEHRITNDINKKVGERNDPNVLVAEDVLVDKRTKLLV